MYIFYNIYLKLATFLRDNDVIFTTKNLPVFEGGSSDLLWLFSRVRIGRNEAFFGLGCHNLNVDVVLTGKE